MTNRRDHAIAAGLPGAGRGTLVAWLIGPRAVRGGEEMAEKRGPERAREAREAEGGVEEAPARGPLQRAVRERAPSAPGTSPLNLEKRAGTFVCAACFLPLFESKMKYESGTGWPSFFETIPDRVATRRDFKLILPRTEYHCARCGGHQGHVFDDGRSRPGCATATTGSRSSSCPRARSSGAALVSRARGSRCALLAAGAARC
jgi:peptide methionine sulfoxide reductase MsrB